MPSTWPWIDHLVSGLHPATNSPYSDSLSLRLPYSVNLATECKSLTHYTKGTQSPHKEAPTVCMNTVSGSISLPFRGSFNLSLTVLVLYRSYYIFSLGRWTSRIQTGFHVSRPTRHSNKKVGSAWRTWLSQSMALLSRSFCSPANL